MSIIRILKLTRMAIGASMLPLGSWGLGLATAADAPSPSPPPVPVTRATLDAAIRRGVDFLVGAPEL